MKVKHINHWYYAFAQPTTYLGIIAITVLLGGAFFLEKDEYNRAYEDGIQRGANLTRVVEENVSHVFDVIDSQIRLLRQLYQRDPKAFDLARFTLNDDQTTEFAIVGLDGKIVSSSPRIIPSGTYVGDQDYFQTHLSSHTDDFYVSAPVIDRISKNATILLSRRLTISDGSFGGVILASLDVRRLQKLYDAIDVGPNGIISLVGFDGIIRARFVDPDYRMRMAIEDMVAALRSAR